MTHTPNHAKSWHQRLPLVGHLRGMLRSAVFRLLRQALETDEGRRMAADALRGTTVDRPSFGQLANRSLHDIYPDLGAGPHESEPSSRADAIFITARFRSGSTLLWNLFRQMKGCTAYYEPLNERRWFDPVHRGSHTDGTHRHVDNYWNEYDGLAELGRYYHEDWTRRHLYMGDDFWEPDLKKYVDVLVDRAPRRPVLQFNRIDFRLPWIRRQFPQATIVHLFRHPRDQWCSMLLDPKSCPRDISPRDFEPHDHFYLLSWARDLAYQFPFLDERTIGHPYQLHYFLWKLSYLFGAAYADYSLAYEHLVESPEAELQRLFDAVHIDDCDVAALARLIEKPRASAWTAYADDRWFADHESHCERVLAEFLSEPQHAAVPTP